MAMRSSELCSHPSENTSPPGTDLRYPDAQSTCRGSGCPQIDKRNSSCNRPWAIVRVSRSKGKSVEKQFP